MQHSSRFIGIFYIFLFSAKKYFYRKNFYSFHEINYIIYEIYKR
ncbi:hypothetical protein HMPREF1584_01410 [Gardnerella vaginalis JCP8481A]|nr:hypothetical protein HMPREF1584_01410 [Gardnerella vaginalis JCP8481A]